MKKIEVFKSKHRLIDLDNVTPGEVLEQITQIDGQAITHIVITTTAGRLLIAQQGKKLVLRFSNSSDQVFRQTEVESRPAVAEIALFFLDNAGMPAGTGDS